MLLAQGGQARLVTTAPPCSVRCAGGAFCCAGSFPGDHSIRGLPVLDERTGDSARPVVPCLGLAQCRKGDKMPYDDQLIQVSNGARGVDRRGFLARCVGCSLATGCMAGARARPVLGKPAAVSGRPKVRLVFSHIPPGQPTWPTINYDYETRKRELTTRLVAGCPEIEFLPATVHTADAARRLISGERDGAITGYLVFMVGLWTGGPR